MGAAPTRDGGRPRRRRLPPLVVLVALAAVGCGGPTTHTLIADDAGGLAVGDPVTASGVRVGYVTRVSTDPRGAQIRFVWLDAAPPLGRSDLVRVRKPFLSARAEVRVTRACGGDTTAVLRGALLREASAIQERMLRVRCGAAPAWRSLRDRIGAFSESESGQVLGEWIQDAREYVGSDEFVEDAGNAVGALRDAGEALLRHFTERGEAAQADSVRRWLEELRQHAR